MEFTHHAATLNAVLRDIVTHMDDWDRRDDVPPLVKDELRRMRSRELRASPLPSPPVHMDADGESLDERADRKQVAERKQADPPAPRIREPLSVVSAIAALERMKPRVIVLGLGSAGKSTLWNALLARDVFATGQGKSTAAITEVVGGDKVKFCKVCTCVEGWGAGGAPLPLTMSRAVPPCKYSLPRCCRAQSSTCTCSACPGSDRRIFQRGPSPL